jgi:hypothetical protein
MVNTDCFTDEGVACKVQILGCVDDIHQSRLYLFTDKGVACKVEMIMILEIHLSSKTVATNDYHQLEADV